MKAVRGPAPSQTSREILSHHDSRREEAQPGGFETEISFGRQSAGCRGFPSNVVEERSNVGWSEDVPRFQPQQRINITMIYRRTCTSLLRYLHVVTAKPDCYVVNLTAMRRRPLCRNQSPLCFRRVLVFPGAGLAWTQPSARSALPMSTNETLLRDIVQHESPPYEVSMDL